MIPLLIVDKDTEQERGQEDTDSVEEEGHTQVAASLLETHGNEGALADEFFHDKLQSVIKGHSRATSDISLVISMAKDTCVRDVDQEVPEEDEEESPEQKSANEVEAEDRLPLQEV